jgi:hypothetical protein
VEEGKRNELKESYVVYIFVFRKGNQRKEINNQRNK